MQDPQFMLHNCHLEFPEQFGDRDPQLRLLHRQTFIYQPPLIEKLPKNIPGIYTIAGGRQIGKTTLLKQWMRFMFNKL